MTTTLVYDYLLHMLEYGARPLLASARYGLFSHLSRCICGFVGQQVVGVSLRRCHIAGGSRRPVIIDSVDVLRVAHVPRMPTYHASMPTAARGLLRGLALVLVATLRCESTGSGHMPRGGRGDPPSYNHGSNMAGGRHDGASRGRDGPGDWKCPCCFARVSRDKSECFNCNTGKPGPGRRYAEERGYGGHYGGRGGQQRYPNFRGGVMGVGNTSGGGPRARGGWGGGGSSRQMHIKINKDLLAAARSGEYLCAMVVERLQDFDAVNAATAYKSLLLMRSARDMRTACDTRARNEALVSLEKVLRDQHVQAFGARDCANTLHTLAKTQGWRPCPDLMCALESRALQVQGDFNPQDIANMLWAFATLGRQPEDALVAWLSERALQVQGAFNPQDIANTLWAFATLERQPEDALLAGLVARSLEVQGDFNPQNIANTLWTFARLGQQPEDALLAGLTARALEVHGNFNSQNIVNTLWAFATLGRQPEDALMDRLTARALEVQGGFNPQDIANMLWAFATLGRQPEDALLARLTARALEVQVGFKPQNIANTLWSFATLGRQPEDALIVMLTTRALEVQGSFDPQNIANTLWAFATLARQPKDALLAGLTARALEVQGAFNPQNIVNTLWAVCFLSIESPHMACRLVCALEPRIAALAAVLPLDVESQRQVHQFVVACHVDQGLRAGMPASILALKETLGPVCHAAFVRGSKTVSKSQQQVRQTLQGMHLWVDEEVICPRSGYSIDVWVHNSPVLQQTGNTSWLGVKDGWAVEFDGPTHFLACSAPTGATLIKRHHLHLLGYTLVSLPYWEWASVCGAQVGAREHYLRRKLYPSTTTHPGPHAIA